MLPCQHFFDVPFPRTIVSNWPSNTTQRKYPAKRSLAVRVTSFMFVLRHDITSFVLSLFVIRDSTAGFDRRKSEVANKVAVCANLLIE